MFKTFKGIILLPLSAGAIAPAEALGWEAYLPSSIAASINGPTPFESFF